MKYDLIILGAGPAGLTAGLYAMRGGLRTCIISKDIGGTANSILELENWPGFKGTGIELMKKFYEQLKSYKIEMLLEDVQNIDKNKKEFLIKTSNRELYTKALILATGRERKVLNIPGEERLKGKGVSYCVICDGFFFKNKVVAVIGENDCVISSALALADIAKKVYVLYRSQKLKCENINLKKIGGNPKIEIIYNAVPKEIKGKEKVESLLIKNANGERELKLDGIFIEMGTTPATEFAKKL